MKSSETNLEPMNVTLLPRFESHGPFLMAGLQARYTCETLDDIPKQWERFISQVRKVSSRIGRRANSRQTCAVFSHPGHVSTIRHTARAIGEEWLPQSGREPAQPSRGEPNLIERYGRQFDPNTGTGDIELWLPIKA